MCFDPDAVPPDPPGGAAPVTGTPVTLTSSDGTRFAAFRAVAPQPRHAGVRTAVVILPDIRGLIGFYERLAERFAGVGIDAIVLDYFGRTAGPGERSDGRPLRGEDFDFRAHIAQTTPEGIAADTTAALTHLEEHLQQHRDADSGGQVQVRAFLLGFCFGGSNAFLQASRTEFAGVIGFYAGMRPRVEGGPTPISRAPEAKVPVLGLFGGADASIPAEQVQQFAAALATSGVEHTLHTYPGAPHSFFDRAYADYAEECADAWRRVLEFIDRRVDVMESAK
ncbi:MAG TPA: dienelactone hydrolase family protein [Actinopolymorphaceae bacterium]|jgi:carboxymethylenebutenolidase